MDSDLIIPLFWTAVVGGITFYGLRRLTKKTPINKVWIRKDPDNNNES